MRAAASDSIVRAIGRLRTRVRHVFHRGRITRFALRLAVPLVVYNAYFPLSYLRPTAAARLAGSADWTTYLVAPNYLRSAPLFTFPIGRVPGYLAPVGSSLAKADSLPILTPLYRLMLALFPGQPIQLVGWILLVGLVGTFFAVTRFCDRIVADISGARREVLTLTLAAIVVIAPFWTIQSAHPALMQHWVLLWALLGALGRTPTFLGGRLQHSTTRWTGLGPIMVAAAVHPYLVPMVAAVALAPDLARLLRAPREVVVKFAVAAGGVLCIAYSLGYLGDGGQTGIGGFGQYAADLATLVDPDLQSRFINDVPSTTGAIGGYGYLGLGGLMVIVVASRLAAQRRRVSTALEVDESVEGAGSAADPWPMRCLLGAVALLTVYSVLPELHLFGRPLTHFEPITARFSTVTSVFRVNGRMIWMAVWLLVLWGIAQFLIARRSAVMISIAVGALLAQLVDVLPWPSLLRSPESVEYSAAYDGLAALKADGITAVHLEPPVVIPGCPADAFGQFHQLGDALLASATLGLPVNSGYTARVEPESVQQNCTEDSAAFERGEYDDNVVYLLPADAPRPPDLQCSVLTSRLIACRTRP